MKVKKNGQAFLLSTGIIYLTQVRNFPTETACPEVVRVASELQKDEFTKNQFSIVTGAIHGDVDHVWIETKNGTIIDPTRTQFDIAPTRLDYSQAFGRGKIDPDTWLENIKLDEGEEAFKDWEKEGAGVKSLKRRSRFRPIPQGIRSRQG